MSPASDTVERPSHHRPDGGYRIPWPMPAAERSAGRAGGLWRWLAERLRHRPPPTPRPDAIPRREPVPALPRGREDELRLTWVGHATFLVQHGGLNLLTDPVWSRRASPFRWVGPKRLSAPGMAFDRLPPIDGVVISHDDYDHLDAPTVRRVTRAHPAARWYAPLGYRGWLEKRGVREVVELDWWDEAVLETEAGRLRLMALPAQHWTRRKPWDGYDRLWAAWRIRDDHGSVFFGGDSGYFAGYAEIGRRAGPFNAALLPIGAYAPRWFMRLAHMDPEEAVRAYRDLGGSGAFVAMHWGTFRLSDEAPLEPPERLRAAWAAAGLPPADLWIPSLGESRSLVA
ncbi:MAG: MBL fold metallo-hydrolase [Gemmatimonadota bacterium]